MASPLRPLDRRRVALAAVVHEDTLNRYLSGGSVRQASEERIRRALRELGFAHLADNPPPSRAQDGR